MIIGIQDEILKIHSLRLLDRLLMDKTTKAHIIWGTDAYTELGEYYHRDKEMTTDLITGNHSGVIKNRARKALEQQSERTRQHAEVFTPLWVCEKMNDHADSVWFDRSQGIHKTDPETGHILFTQNHKWRYYVDSRRLEITCGEAPYLVSRYDVSTGESIPLSQRIGILDRKLRAVTENAETEEEWLEWAVRAFQSTYGYEFQGDNVLIARVNLLETFEEYLFDRWKRKPTDKEYQTIINIICWNIWQMDGLTGTIPYCKAEEEYQQLDLFGWLGMETVQQSKDTQPRCRIYDWRRDNSLEFLAVNKGERNMKFDFIIGNPPYQETTDSESTRMLPLYDKFMDASYEISDVVELITPARFLFDAGQTQKVWNEKMLSDRHLKVLHYEQDAAKVFPNTDIKGGVAITYHNKNEQFEPIGIFIPWNELRSIERKAGSKSALDSLTDIADSSPTYDLKNIYEDHPDYRAYIADEGRHSQLKTNVLNINPIFTEKPDADDDYIIYGLVNGKRGYKYCNRKYIKSSHKSLSKYKVLVPKAAGSGQLNDSFPEIFIVGPGAGFTQTYISMGMFESEAEAKHLEKYIKTKFCRSLLYVLKVTQDNLPSVWRCIPKQDFTASSDIDWSKSVAEIDRQLYAKYGLDDKEIEFIETHVKEMA